MVDIEVQKQDKIFEQVSTHHELTVIPLGSWYDSMPDTTFPLLRRYIQPVDSYLALITVAFLALITVAFLFHFSLSLLAQLFLSVEAISQFFGE